MPNYFYTNYISAGTITCGTSYSATICDSITNNCNTKISANISSTNIDATITGSARTSHSASWPGPARFPGRPAGRLLATISKPNP